MRRTRAAVARARSPAKGLSVARPHVQFVHPAEGDAR